MRLLPLLLLALSGHSATHERATAAALSAETACPAETSHSRASVTNFLSSDNLAADRQQIGMTGVAPTGVRLLTDASDATMCQRLAATVQLGPGRYPRVSTYYTAGGFYFVATTYVVPPDRMWISHEPLLVFDANLKFLGSYAM